MKSKWFVGILAGILTFALVTESAFAQGRRGGGGAGFGIQTPYFSGYYGRGGYYGGYGRGYGGYGYYRPYGGGYYGYPNYSDYGYSYGYPAYGYYSNEYPGYAQSTVVPSQSFYSGPVTEQNKVLVHIRVSDPEATVWIENTRTDQKGFDRLFTSPELEAGKQYVYTIKAQWQDNGQERTQEKKVTVEPGRSVIVAFGQPSNAAPAAAPLPNSNLQRRGGIRSETTKSSYEPPGSIAESSAAKVKTHNGKVILAENGQIVMTDLQENRHTHRLADNAQILVNGKKADLKDLKPGDQVRVTTKEGDKNTAIKIELVGGATSPNDDRQESQEPLPPE